MTNSHGITKGINDPANHEACLEAITAAIDATAEAGFPNVITFSGNRDGMPDSEGLENCVVALKQVVGHAEQKGVTICMELLNSKVNHADYMADNMPWLVELVDRVASDRFKILYDIYHAQVMEGDVIRTIRDHHEHIGHYHTAGNPGRNELDEDQELYYPAIMLRDPRDRLHRHRGPGVHSQEQRQARCSCAWLWVSATSSDDRRHGTTSPRARTSWPH